MTNRVASFFVHLGKPLEKVGEIGLEVAAVIPISAPIAGPLEMIVRGVTAPGVKTLANLETGSHTLNIGGTMGLNQLEQFAFMIILGVLNSVVKNPAHKAAMQTSLLTLAADIQEEYGLTPPPMPEVQVAPPSASTK